MKFSGLLAFLFSFAMFFADDPTGGGKPDDTPPTPKEDDTPPPVPPKDDNSDLRAELEKERVERKKLEDKIAAQERQKAEENGQWEKLYKEEKEARETERNKFILNSATNAFKAEAIKQGCQSPDDLAQLMQKEIRKLEVDPVTFSFKEKSLQDLVSQAKTSKALFFNAPGPKIDDLDPSGKSTKKKGDYLSELQQAKTQKEIDEVRKKHGRI